MTAKLPDSLLVIERGWLSANNILAFDGERATLIDSGYVTHAEQTVDLLRHALAGCQLERLLNTHSHSDHIGGNAAVQAAFGCSIAVPAGLQASIAEWDEDALLLSPLGQQAAPFRHDALIEAGSAIEFAGLNWQALAVPGHDMEALAFYNQERRLLISGDALWENGFGVVFPELLGTADGLTATRATLEMLGRLPIDIVIPGHGAPFADVDRALATAFRRLDGYCADIERLAWHALKVIVAFALMERQQLPATGFADFLASLPFAVDINQRYLALAEDELTARLLADLSGAGVLVHREDMLILR
ncbi:MBL fold metallo-hydrolase [Azonexus caeni]|jgi:glyoxylase-like metal-dependent hydrolase (beta-lactamase superfamily II)|uniref:MBL fold metallo-hydrolase n=1 Tax=Azonexus caeni TaxID=266126 RepID=UPI003A8C7920